MTRRDMLAKASMFSLLRLQCRCRLVVFHKDSQRLSGLRSRDGSCFWRDDWWRLAQS